MEGRTRAAGLQGCRIAGLQGPRAAGQPQANFLKTLHTLFVFYWVLIGCSLAGLQGLGTSKLSPNLCKRPLPLCPSPAGAVSQPSLHVLQQLGGHGQQGLHSLQPCRSAGVPGALMLRAPSMTLGMPQGPAPMPPCIPAPPLVRASTGAEEEEEETETGSDPDDGPPLSMRGAATPQEVRRHNLRTRPHASLTRKPLDMMGSIKPMTMDMLPVSALVHCPKSASMLMR